MVGTSIPSPHIADVLIADGNITVCKGNSTDIEVYIFDTCRNLGQRIKLTEGIDCGIFAGFCIILIVNAVVLNSILCGKNSNSNAVDGQTLILVAGSSLHHTLNFNFFGCICGQMRITVFGYICAGDLPINNLIQLGITLNAGDLNLVLQRKIALVDDAQVRQLIPAARLPENLLIIRCVGSFLEL